MLCKRAQFFNTLNKFLLVGARSDIALWRIITYISSLYGYRSRSVNLVLVCQSVHNTTNCQICHELGLKSVVLQITRKFRNVSSTCHSDGNLEVMTNKMVLGGHFTFT